MTGTAPTEIAAGGTPVEAESGLAEGWAWTTIGEACELNPPKAAPNALPPVAPVTFVPMPAVDAESGTIAWPVERPFGEVRKGFTSFRDEDVIMAKITPCMENGKAAIARGLTNEEGFIKSGQQPTIGDTPDNLFQKLSALLDLLE